MALIKCPRCSRRFESVAASRTHAETAHGDRDTPHDEPNAGDSQGERYK
jgi:uncharacterized C2H2 Zn-finger protein